MKSNTSVHLIGSVGLKNEEDVFRALASHLGSSAKRYPDGETGERHYWIRWQQKVFDGHPDFELAEEREGYRKDTPLRFYRPRGGVDPAAIAFSELGYASAAIASYETFARLKQEGVIPASVRFLVALPTALAVITSFVIMPHRQAIEPVYEQALIAELHRICNSIPHDQVSIQWDVCHEILAADGAFPLHYSDVCEGTMQRLSRLCSQVPPDVELGIHLCYGDPGHKHIKEPTDTGTAVSFTNSIIESISRKIDWVHLPVPRERADDAYFMPLRNLRLTPDTELVLGLVHYTDGVEGTLRRAQTAKKFTTGFGIATECGFGRRDPSTIPGLLTIHKQVAERI